MTMPLCQVCNDNSDDESCSSVEEEVPAEVYVPLSLPNEVGAAEHGCYCLPTSDCPARPLSDEGEGGEVTREDLEGLRLMAKEVVAMRAFQDRSAGPRRAETPTSFGLGSLSSSSVASSRPARPDSPRPNYRGDGPVWRQARAAPPAARPAVPPRTALDSPDHPSHFPGARRGGSSGMPSLPFVVRRNPDGTLA